MRTAVYRVGADAALRWARPRRPRHATVAHWNEELSGRMSAPNRNGRVSNALRDATSVVLIRLCGPAPVSVLDVGCGFGDLATALAGEGIRRYVGVDLSDYVIDRARRESPSWPVARVCDLRFCRSDLRRFEPSPDDRFDVIVFNEVLKYVTVDEAVAHVKRYTRWLTPAGVVCVNLTDDPKNHAIFRALAGHLSWIYGTVYQQRPDAPLFRLTRNRAVPAYLSGLFRPAATPIEGPEA